MENILEKTVKENGNIDLNELSWKQVVALLGAWDSSFARNENTSFSEMVKRCYKSRPWHENANIIYLHRNNQKTTILPHACYNLDEAEEDMKPGQPRAFWLESTIVEIWLFKSV